MYIIKIFYWAKQHIFPDYIMYSLNTFKCWIFIHKMAKQAQKHRVYSEKFWAIHYLQAHTTCTTIAWKCEPTREWMNVYMHINKWVFQLRYIMCLPHLVLFFIQWNFRVNITLISVGFVIIFHAKETLILNETVDGESDVGYIYFITTLLLLLHEMLGWLVGCKHVRWSKIYDSTDCMVMLWSQWTFSVIFVCFLKILWSFKWIIFWGSECILPVVYIHAHKFSHQMVIIEFEL